jgi:calcineurin-like phosphoesterase family protein
LDQTIHDGLNASVKANDILYFLGDFCIGSKAKALEHREQIRCKKIFAVPDMSRKTNSQTDRGVFLARQPCGNLHTLASPS